MVQVSEKFKELAKSAGRHVSCKIAAGENVFYDDKIFEFDFNDVIHPDWVTIGTACANRFAFSILYENEIDVHTEVKPFISFDGEEWCPLGVFYVTRRYIRGKYASIICYDKMYSLDIPYSTSLSAPTTTSELLREICSSYGIACADYGEAYDVKKIPADCTVRDMIGFIAAVYKSNAKFDRTGSLVFKTYFRQSDEVIEPANYMDFSANQTSSAINHITVDTGETILESGEGGKLTSIELYNPLMSQSRLTTVQRQMRPIGFYGAEIEMQGLPFFESGDALYLLDTIGHFLYVIILSEVDYHYDGALTAKAYSRNRGYTNSAVLRDELEAELEDIRASLGNVYRKLINEKAISLSTAETTVAEFTFEAKKTNVFAQVDLNFTVDGGGSNTLTAAVYVNGSKFRESVHTVNGSSRELLHFYYLAENLPRGVNTIKVTLRTESGQMTIQSGQLIATLVGKGMAGGGQNIRDRMTIFEVIPTISLSCCSMQILGMSENMQTEIEIKEA